MTLTDRQIAEFKEQLLTERLQLIESESDVLHSELDRIDLRARHPNNSDELKRTDAVEKEIALESHVMDSLARVDLALTRISSKDYGICIDCNGDIPYQRLVAFPAAARCIECKSKLECEAKVSSLL